MTDKETIKALKFCCLARDNCCEDCPFSNRCRYNIEQIEKEALDIINRQKAEIEKLQISIGLASDKYRVGRIKAEAVKEFAEKLKDRIVNFPSAYPTKSATLAFLNGSSHRQLEILEIINNLVKEMVGD